MNLFIDSNLFLLFFQYSDDDLNELDKLRGLLRKGDVTLWLPEQVSDEYRRNREKTISTAVKELKQQNLNLRFPAMSKGYGEHEILRKLQGDYSKHLNKLVTQITTDAQNKSLKADRTIESLMSLAKPIQSTESLQRLALQRHQRGNPPGKSSTIGDELNWEALLSAVPKSEDICIITDDNDYASDLDRTKFNPFLMTEWFRLKGSGIWFYKNLTDFFLEKYPQIKFDPDFELNLLISQFVNSGSFAATHSAIAGLTRFSSFSDANLNDLASAVVANRQIHWIIDDDDVYSFVKRLVVGNEAVIAPEMLAAIAPMLAQVEADKAKES